METITDGLNKLVRQAFDMVGNAWYNNNGTEGLVEFLLTLDHMKKHDEKKLTAMVNRYLGVVDTDDKDVGSDSWVEEYTGYWFSSSDKFWNFYTKMDQPTRMKLLNWLALKYEQRNHA